MALRRLNIAVVAAAAAAVGLALPASAASVNARAKAKVIKPLALKSIQDLELGVLILSPGDWSGSTVSLSREGVLTCPAKLTCSGAIQVAVYNVTGSNGQTVVINAPEVTMVNQASPGDTLTLVVDGPGTVSITNSGARGLDFALGGSIAVDSTTPGGDYVGTFEVTAEYQ